MRSRRHSGLWSLVLIAHPAGAHHSIAGVYNTNESTEVSGVIVEFRLIRPHALLLLETRAGASEPQVWQLEMDNHFELVGIGITADTFRAGDEVVVNGNPSHDGSSRLYLRELRRPADGLVYAQVGYRPVLNAPP